jgi:primosomal protein N' (replication factor Y) (superfamily II helicase)
MIVDVALPIPVAKTFSYTVPDRWKPFAKKFVRLRVPFHNKVHTGVITDICNDDDPKLKEISEIIDFFPIIDNTLIDLTRWSSYFYITPIGPVLKYILPPTLKIEPYIAIESTSSETITMDGLTLKKAIHLFGRESLFHYHEKGLIALHNILTKQVFSPITQGNEKKELPANILFIGNVQNRLIYYIDAIASAIQKGLNVLMLLPDHYAAGNYFKKVFTERFGDRVLWYGSETKTKSRMEIFFRVRDEGGFLVLGNKSCVFLPICKQALIIVERHEEDEYRNEEGFKYNAALVAVKRASIGNIPVILGSACPSMEMYYYAKTNKFSILEKEWLLDGFCQEKIVAPDIYSSSTFLEELLPAIKETAAKGERIAVFTPRKDYGSYLVCHSCRKPFLCPDCEGVLGYEKEAGRLVCSICGKSFPYEERCTHCGSNIIRFARIGAEYVEEKLKGIFQDVNIMKITGDSLKKEIKTLNKMQPDSSALLIGTQSLSKLYNFHVQKLILVGWEELRKMGGYRSDEKMIQILINLIDALTPDSIALLMEKKKKVTISSYLKVDTYYQEELQRRKNADFPPYRRVFLVEVENKSKGKGEKTITKIKDILQYEGVESAISGTLMEKKTLYKWKIILRGEENLLGKALFRIYNLSGVQIEADPLYV